VTGWTVVFLGIIALATLVMATIQVGAILYAGRLARRVERLTEQFQRDVGPLIAKATLISHEAARATSTAAAQVERVDRLLADLALRMDETLTLVQDAIVTPAREGVALIRGLRAAVAALRSFRAGRGPRRVEDEDALFIG
jgi:hypothetical protein